MGASAAVDWRAIDTVLLDMDGTLLDLRFDNWFWQEHVPGLYAARHSIPFDAARAKLEPRFRAASGTIDWYCIDFWTRELGLDIAAIKRAARANIGYLPGAKRFLSGLGASGKRRVLITNAHPETLAIKNEHTALGTYLDASYSSHQFEAPKESPGFWLRFSALENFDPRRTLLVDDNLSVLECAREHGIAWLRAVRRPDSGRPPQDTGEFAAVDRVDDLL